MLVSIIYSIYIYFTIAISEISWFVLMLVLITIICTAENGKFMDSVQLTISIAQYFCVLVKSYGMNLCFFKRLTVPRGHAGRVETLIKKQF